MANHKGIRLRIQTPDGDILNESSLRLHWTCKLRERYVDPSEWQEVITLAEGHPNVKILMKPEEEWEDEEEEC
jgi:hypothetical protein